MKKYLLVSFILFYSFLHSTSLKKMYDSAQPQDEFQKYINLETGVTGGSYHVRLFGRGNVCYGFSFRNQFY